MLRYIWFILNILSYMDIMLWVILNIMLQIYINELMAWLLYFPKVPGHIGQYNALHQCF